MQPPSTCRIMDSVPGFFNLRSTLSFHDGCVNRLSWNSSGSRLASVSDDRRLAVWDYRDMVDGSKPAPHKNVTTGKTLSRPRTQTCFTSLRTVHEANIFGVSFVPGSSDQCVVSGGMDGIAARTDFQANGRIESRQMYSLETRIKAVATVQASPWVCWMASTHCLSVVRSQLRHFSRRRRVCDSV